MNDLIDTNGSRGKVAHYDKTYQNDMHIVWIYKTPRDYRAKKTN